MQMVTKQILVVTDSPQIASILTSKLERDSFSVISKSSAQDALTLLHKENFSLAILDSLLPDRSAMELLKAIRSSFQQSALPIFILLDALQEHTAEEYFSAGANEVLSKPFRPTDVSKRITKILNTVNDLVQSG